MKNRPTIERIISAGVIWEKEQAPYCTTSNLRWVYRNTETGEVVVKRLGFSELTRRRPKNA